MPCHDDTRRGPFKGYQCFLELHNEQRFGLAKVDCGLIKKDKKDWIQPTPVEIESNSRHIEKIQRKIPYGLRRQVSTIEDSI
jgi:hypothetical protein